MVAVFNPTAVSAGGNPLASPTPQPTQRVTAPEISGVNPEVVLSEGNQGDSHPSDIFSFPVEQIPLDLSLAVIPELPAPVRDAGDFPPGRLPVPLRYQNSGEPNCGPAALGMALDYLERNQDAITPSTPQLSAFLSSQGLMYAWGTGVEELALAARHYGYQGSYAFYDGNLDQLGELLARGLPPVLSLGTGGPGSPGHFVTLTGIAGDGSRVSYNDPLQGEVALDAGEFLSLWELQGRAGMVPVREADTAAGADQVLPWMGLASALSLMGLAGQDPGRSRSERNWRWTDRSPGAGNQRAARL